MRPAEKLDLAPKRSNPNESDQSWEGERWPRGARILFLLAAAILCWGVPLALLYWLFY